MFNDLNAILTSSRECGCWSMVRMINLIILTMFCCPFTVLSVSNFESFLSFHKFSWLLHQLLDFPTASTLSALTRQVSSELHLHLNGLHLHHLFSANLIFSPSFLIFSCVFCSFGNFWIDSLSSHRSRSGFVTRLLANKQGRIHEIKSTDYHWPPK